MNTYFINELGHEMTYIEIRFCLSLNCPKRFDKIAGILEFLNRNHFLCNITFFYDESIAADSFQERNDVASLTIDINNGKMRFKYWNGAETLWTYDSQDLSHSLMSGREKYAQIYAKYYPIIHVLQDVEHNFSTSIRRITYTYYPKNNNIEMQYFITFSKEVQESQTTKELMDIITEKINALGHDVIDTLKFDIEVKFDNSKCIPCQKKKQELINEAEN